MSIKRAPVLSERESRVTEPLVALRVKQLLFGSPMALTRRPRLRGVLHTYAAVLFVGLGAALVVTATGTRAHLAALIYALSVCGLFGTSATYHRVSWRPSVRRRMRWLDHSMIFVLIAGTYTPVALVVLRGSFGSAVLWALWGGGLLGAALGLAWPQMPRPVSASIYVGLGALTLLVTGRLVQTVGWLAVSGLVVGGIVYGVGAVIYARGRPDPVPAVFGYHELFHALVIAAALIQYAVIAFAVLPYRWAG